MATRSMVPSASACQSSSRFARLLIGGSAFGQRISIGDLFSGKGEVVRAGFYRERQALGPGRT